MLSRRFRPFIAPVTLLVLACCAGPPVAGPTVQTVAAAPAAAGPKLCGFRALGHSLRSGQDLPFIFTVKAGSQWCFDGFEVGGLSTAGQSIEQAPSHGQLRLVPRPGAVIVGYRPKPGYIGSDHFRIGVPSQIETAYFAGSVTVEP